MKKTKDRREGNRANKSRATMQTRPNTTDDVESKIRDRLTRISLRQQKHQPTKLSDRTRVFTPGIHNAIDPRREMFLNELAQLQPNIPQEIRHLGSVELVEDYLGKCNLSANWIKEAALRILETHVPDPSLEEVDPWLLIPLSYELLPSKARTISFSRLEATSDRQIKKVETWEPTKQSEEHFRNEARASFYRMLDDLICTVKEAYEKAEYRLAEPLRARKATGSKETPRDFAWLIMFQVQRKSFAEIAEEETIQAGNLPDSSAALLPPEEGPTQPLIVEAKAVAKNVRALAKSIGLPLRPVPRGRPRKR